MRISYNFDVDVNRVLCKYTHSFVQTKYPSKHPALIYFTSEMISSILILEREFECMFNSHDNAAQNTYIQNTVYSLSICGNNPIIKYHIMSHQKACDLIVFSMYTFFLNFNANVSLNDYFDSPNWLITTLFFSVLPLSRVLYVVYVSVENYVLYTRLK